MFSLHPTPHPLVQSRSKYKTSFSPDDISVHDHFPLSTWPFSLEEKNRRRRSVLTVTSERDQENEFYWCFLFAPLSTRSYKVDQSTWHRSHPTIFLCTIIFLSPQHHFIIFIKIKQIFFFTTKTTNNSQFYFHLSLYSFILIKYV